MKTTKELRNGIVTTYRKLDNNEKEILGLIDDTNIIFELLMSIKTLENGVLYHTAPFSNTKENRGLNARTLKTILKEDAYIEVSSDRQ